MAYLIDEETKEKVELTDAIITESYTITNNQSLEKNGDMLFTTGVSKEGYTPVGVVMIRLENDEGTASSIGINSFDVQDGYALMVDVTGNRVDTVAAPITCKATVLYVKA